MGVSQQLESCPERSFPNFQAAGVVSDFSREIHFPIQKLEFTNSGSYQAAPFLWVVTQKQLCRMVINVWKHPPHARRAASTEYYGVYRRRFPFDSSNRVAVESTSRPHTLDTLRSKTHGTWAGPSQWISPIIVIS